MVYSIELGYDPEEWEECPDDEYFMLFGFFTRMFLSLVAVGTTALLFWFIEARKQWAKLAKDTTETQQAPIYIQTMTTKGPEQTILRVKEGLTAKDVSLLKGEQYQQRDESTFSKEEQEALEEWRREVARLEEDRLRQLDDHFSGEYDRLSEIETESQLIDALLPTDEISYDSQGTDVDQYDYLKDIGATPTCTPQNSADATGENIHLDEVNRRLDAHDQNLLRTPEHLTRPSESERVKMEAVSIPAAGNGLDDWVTTPSATDMLEKETSEAMASPPEESPLKESAAPIQPRSVEPQQMRISSDSENGFVKVYEEKDTTTTSDSIILIPRSAVIMSATDGVPESEHIYDIPTVDQRDQRQFAGWSLQQPTATSEQPKAEIIIDDSRKVIVPEEEKFTEREQKLEDITKDQQQPQQQPQQEPYSRIPLEPTVIDGGPPAQFDARTTAAPASVQYQKTDTELALGEQRLADSQPQILAEREPQKPAIQTSVEPPESVVSGESVTGKVVEEYRYDSGKPDERVGGEQPAEGGSDFMKPAASSVYATIPSVLAQQPAAAASTTTVETTVKLQPHIPSGEHAPLQAESVQTQEFISQETMGNLEPKKLIEETIGPKGDHYAEEPNKVKDLEGLAKKEAEELQKLFEEYQIIAEKPAEPASYSKPMPVAEYAELHQTPQQPIKTIPPEHPPFPSASFEQELPLKGSTYQPEQVPVPQQQQAEELPSPKIQSTNLVTERDQSDQRRVRSDRPGRILGIRVEKPEYEEAKVKRFVETVQTPEEFEYSRSHPVRVSEHVGAKMSEGDQQRSKDEALERQRDQQETAAATAAIELASDEMKRLAEVDIYVQDAMDYVSAQRQEQDEMYRAQYPLPESQQAAQAGSRMDTISGFVIEEEMLESVGRSGGHQLPLSGLQKQPQQLQKKPEDSRVHEHERERVHEHEPEHGRDRDREKAREVDREHDRKEEREHLKATFSNEQISGEATSELVHTNEEFEKIEHIAELDDTMTYAPEIQSIEIPPDRSSENSENLQEYFDQVAAECMVGVFKQPQKPGRFPTEAPSAIPTQKLTDMTPSISSAKSYTSSEGERLQKQSSLLSAVGATNMQEMLLALTSLEELSVAMAKAGLESTNLIFGIDYTASNKYQGEQCFGGRSLHSIDPFIPNPYQQVISVMGRTLAPFATSGFIPAYGFGDAKTGDRSVFKLKDDGECRNLDEVLRVYNKVTPTVSLSGPTNFAPVIYQAIEICEAVQDYHILVIVADGQVTNEKATRKAIVRACQYPLSIIVVGVGDGPWDMMRVFDDSLPKRPWDNFHFVEFHDVMRKAKGIQSGELSFAIQSLLEIPDQYGIVKQLGLVRGSKLHSKAK